MNSSSASIYNWFSEAPVTMFLEAASTANVSDISRANYNISPGALAERPSLNKSV